MRKTCNLDWVLSIGASALFPGISLGLAVAGNQVVNNLPAGVNNSIVQVSAGGFGGTGSIVLSYGYNGGTVFDVLTADHVIRDDSSAKGASLFAPGKINVGFGNAANPNPAASAVTTDFTIPSGGTSAVDLAMLSVYVLAAQVPALPAFTPLQIGTGVAANDAIVQSGYGYRANASPVNVYNALNMTNFPGYVYRPGTGLGYGTLLSGKNNILKVTANLVGASSFYDPGTGAVKYQYNGITGGTAITANGAGGYNGTSYALEGDSGGPTLELVKGQYVIVGVHASSYTYDSYDKANVLLESDVIPYADDNSFIWKDVNAMSYSAWITSAEGTVKAALPEPSSLTLLAFGGLGLLHRRRGRA